MLPPGYWDVTGATTARGPVNVIGIVVDVFGDSQPTSRSSYCATFTIKDSNLDNGNHWDGLRIKYYSSERTSLPPVRNLDVIIIQNIAVKAFNGKTMAVAAQHELVPWAIFRQESDRATSISPISGPSPFEPSPVERKYALSLMKRTATVDTTGHRRSMGPRQNSNAYTAAIVQDATRGSPSDYFTLIKDIRERSYVVLIGEVVNIWANDSEKVVIDVTDYTSNQDLYNFGNDGREGDPFNYVGSSPNPKRKRPSGKMTLRVTLWDAHAEYAREHLMLNDFVRLQKVHIKRSRANGTLEAVLHAERHNPNKVNISKIQSSGFDGDKSVLELSNRKAAYWGKRGNDAPEDNGDFSSRTTKPNKKKKKDKKEEPTIKEDQKPLVIGQRSKINQNVQAAYPGIKTQRVEDILTKSSQKIKSPDGIEYELPFQNIRYRSVIKVVDFFPPKLEDFAVPQKSAQPGRSASDDDDGDNDYSNDFVRWSWRFCLLVESAATPPPGEPKERMPLFVAGPEAEYLLRMDAVNLRKDRTALKALREKLFILWGDLEERKSKAIADGITNPDSFGPVSCRPFTCCIKEYGVRCSHGPVANHESGCSHEDCLGWAKRFAMFETTIMTP